jgi:hypothetical protein
LREEFDILVKELLQYKQNDAKKGVPASLPLLNVGTKSLPIPNLSLPTAQNVSKPVSKGRG